MALWICISHSELYCRELQNDERLHTQYYTFNKKGREIIFFNLTYTVPCVTFHDGNISPKSAFPTDLDKNSNTLHKFSDYMKTISLVKTISKFLVKELHQIWPLKLQKNNWNQTQLREFDSPNILITWFNVPFSH